MENLASGYELMEAVYSGNMDKVNELTDATEDLTDVQEDNVDAVEDQADAVQLSAVEFDKYTEL